MKRSFILILLVLISVIICGCNDSYGDLDASVEYGSSELKITNENDYVWSDVSLELNGSYECWFRSLSPGKTRIVEFNDFTDQTGMPFLPNFQTIASLEIRAYRPDGVESVFSLEANQE